MRASALHNIIFGIMQIQNGEVQPLPESEVNRALLILDRLHMPQTKALVEQDRHQLQEGSQCLAKFGQQKHCAHDIRHSSTQDGHGHVHARQLRISLFDDEDDTLEHEHTSDSELHQPDLPGSSQSLIGRTGLHMHMASECDTLSHTELAKVHLARALVLNPELLILQRPLRAYTPGAANVTMSVIQEHVAGRGLFPLDVSRKRRPRTCLFSPETADQAGLADVIWQIEAQVQPDGHREKIKSIVYETSCNLVRPDLSSARPRLSLSMNLKKQFHP